MFSGRRIEKSVIEYEGGGPNPKRRRRLDGRTEGFEHIRENAITRRPMSRILRETLQDHRSQRPRNLRPHLSRRDRRFGRDARDEGDEIAIVEWRLDLSTSSAKLPQLRKCPSAHQAAGHVVVPAMRIEASLEWFPSP